MNLWDEDKKNNLVRDFEYLTSIGVSLRDALWELVAEGTNNWVSALERNVDTVEKEVDELKELLIEKEQELNELRGINEFYLEETQNLKEVLEVYRKEKQDVNLQAS